MKKTIAAMALAASMLAAAPVAPAQAQGTDCPACLVGCLVRWTFDYVTYGLTHPGYTCADIN